MKLTKKAVALIMSLFLLCSVFTAAPIFASAEQGDNLALSATATADGSETASLSADKVNDGSSETRWASPVSQSAHWVQLAFSEPQTVRSISVAWERKNVTDFDIQTSDTGEDGSWTDIYSFNGEAVFDNAVTLQSAVSAKYFRIYINTFSPSGPDRNGQTVTWSTCSIYEIEMYEGEFPEQTLTVDDVIADIQNDPPTVADDAAQIPLPEVPEGFTVEFNGADYSQIIGDNGVITRPLNDNTVKYSYKVSDGTQTKVTNDISITVKGTFTADENSNDKPVVIPELAEWAGAQGGEFALSDSPKAIIDEASYNALDADEKEKCEAVRESLIADFREITGKTLTISIGDVSAASSGDIAVKFCTEDTARLGNEGYKMNVDDVLTVEANTEKGMYWATRSILQILKQGDTIEKGLCYDYPRYSLRGIMIDVGRMPISLSTLEELAKTMSWYKMNDLGVHLYDNFIWVERYSDTEDPYGAYAGFRLESDVKEGGNNGKNQCDLTSKDLYYTKDEFRSFIKDMRTLGIDVVPEFDSPAHSLSITKVRPDLSLKKGTVNRWADHLDLSNPESIQFVQDLWNEYTQGSNPVFDMDTILNIGSDEYEANANQFKNYVHEMLNWADGNGYTTRLWGNASTDDKDYAPAVADPSNAQVYIWSKGYANPVTTFNNGFNVINILDGTSYIVPGANYYGDYLSASDKYNNYDPATGLGVPSSDKRMLGGAYAVWNDYVGDYANGMTDYDIFDRLYVPMIGYASKLWGDAEDMSYSAVKEYADVISTAPGTNPYNEVPSNTDLKVSYEFDSQTIEDASGNGYDVTKISNAEVTQFEGRNALKLNGAESFASTPIDFFGNKAELSFSVYRENESTDEQILFETSDKFEVWAIKAVQKETGKLGFSREGVDYSFDYTLPVGEWTDIKIIGMKDFAELYVNGEFVEKIGTSDRQPGEVRESSEMHATLMIPFARIGSETNAFSGYISNVKVVQEEPFNAATDETIIDRTNFTVTTDNENPLAGGGNEGPVSLAFDGNTDTIWHTDYTNYKALPAEVIIDMKQEYAIDKLTYVPRQGSVNGRILTYKIAVKTNESDEWTEIVSDGVWENSAEIKFAKFDAVNARYVKFTAVTGATDSSRMFASAAEMYIHKSVSEPEEFELGDVDHSRIVDASDATLVLQRYANIIDDSYAGYDGSLADVDANGDVDAADASLILQLYAGIISSFSVI